MPKHLFARRLSWARLALAGWLLAGAVGAIRAADVLQAIPDSALVIVVINRLEESSEKLEKLAGLVHAPQQSVLTMLRVQTGIHEGLDEKGSAAIVLLPPQQAGGKPQVVVLLPVTDYRRFLTQLQPADATQKFAEVRMAGNAVLIAQHGEFAAIAPSDGKQALDDVLNSLKDAGADLASQKAWLEEVDAAVVATTPGIKYAAEQAPTWLMQLRGLAQMAAPQQSATFGEMIESLQEGLKVFGDQVTHVALGVKADENTNLRISARTRFAAGQAWSTAAKGIKAPKEGVLAGLPTGPFELACGLTLPERIRQLAVGQIPNVFKANPVLAAVPAEQQTKLTEAAGELISSLDSLALVLAAPKAGEPQFAAHVAVLKVDDAAKYLDRYAAAVEMLAGALKPPQNPLAAYSAQKIDVDGTAALDIVADWSALSPPGAPEVKPAFEKMFGPGDKAHCYLAAVDDKTVVLAYVGLENLKRAIADAKATGAGLAADARVAETTALLPKGGQWLILIQPPTADDLAGALAGAGPPPTAQPPSGPPVGITAKISAAGLNFDIAAPKAALELIGASVGQARGLQ